MERSARSVVIPARGRNTVLRAAVSPVSVCHFLLKAAVVCVKKDNRIELVRRTEESCRPVCVCV